jgi:amidase
MAEPLPLRSATELAGLLAGGDVASVDLLDQQLSRIERFNPTLNAVVVLDAERARHRAAAADAARAAGQSWGPLHGLPITVKESFDVAGLATTYGDPRHRHNVAATTAVAVQRLIDAGAIVIGKTNIPLNLADWQSYNEVYGSTSNPWDLGRTPGGSSGGSAVAVATGMSALELGSDIGGSIRNPAHCCGVFGHKPTYGVVSALGHGLPHLRQPLDISACGPLARSAADLRLAMGVLAGPSGRAARAWRLELPPPSFSGLADLRVAVVLDDPNANVDTAVQDQIAAAAELLARHGASVDRQARPDFDTTEFNDIYVGLLRAATAQVADDSLFESSAEVAAAADPDDRSYGVRAARGLTMSHRRWLQLNERRAELAAVWDQFFDRFDVVLCPAAVSTAFPHDQAGERNARTIVVNGADQLVTDQIFWAGYANLTGLPATVAPIGTAPDGLPVGVQIIGPPYGDHTTLALAELLEQTHRAFQAPPAYA